MGRYGEIWGDMGRYGLDERGLVQPRAVESGVRKVDEVELRVGEVDA